MSTARLVPETGARSGAEAWSTLRRAGGRPLLRDAFQRLRWADGFSHSRSLAFLVALTAVQAVIALVGVTSAFGGSNVSDTIVDVVRGAAPGPVAGLLTDTVTHARDAGSSHNYLPLLLGTAGWLVSATTAMGQLERGLNRLYGVEEDRPFRRKYGLALLLAASAGVVMTAAFVLLTVGRTASTAAGSETAAHLLDGAGWPVAVALLGAAILGLLRWCPRRRQPGWPWLAAGAAVALVLGSLITLGLGAFFRHSAGFGETYGALAGMVALFLWALLSSIGLLFGAAVAAQLEAVRAQAPSPQDGQKAAASEPGPAPGRPRPALSGERS